VELGGAGSNDESNYSGLDKLLYSWPAKVVNAVALFRGAPEPAANAVVVKRDSNIDSGCSIIMTPYKDNLLHTCHDDTEICLASHSLVSATHKGVAALTFEVDASVLDLHKPLLSVSGVCDQNLSVVFTSTSCEIYRLKDVKAIGKPVERGYRKGNSYYLPAHEVNTPSLLSSVLSSVDSSLLGYHICMLHVGPLPLKKLLSTLNIKPSVMNKINVQRCPVCVHSKMHHTAFKSRLCHRAQKPGQIIHLDVGSFEEVSREGYKYYVTFVDDYSKFLSVFPMKSKSNVFLCFKLFCTAFEKDGCFSIPSLRPNNGGEYISSDFAKYLSEAGISHKPGPPHSPELNGVAERTNCTISNLLQCSLLNAKLPKPF
jgi:hypothetical protein